jgi:hypothetical protein
MSNLSVFSQVFERASLDLMEMEALSREAATRPAALRSSIHSRVLVITSTWEWIPAHTEIGISLDRLSHDIRDWIETNGLNMETYITDLIASENILSVSYPGVALRIAIKRGLNNFANDVSSAAEDLNDAMGLLSIAAPDLRELTVDNRDAQRYLRSLDQDFAEVLSDLSLDSPLGAPDDVITSTKTEYLLAHNVRLGAKLTAANVVLPTGPLTANLDSAGGAVNLLTIPAANTHVIIEAYGGNNAGDLSFDNNVNCEFEFIQASDFYYRLSVRTTAAGATLDVDSANPGMYAFGIVDIYRDVDRPNLFYKSGATTTSSIQGASVSNILHTFRSNGVFFNKSSSTARLLRLCRARDQYALERGSGETMYSVLKADYDARKPNIALDTDDGFSDGFNTYSVYDLSNWCEAQAMSRATKIRLYSIFLKRLAFYANNAVLDSDMKYLIDVNLGV